MLRTTAAALVLTGLAAGPCGAQTATAESGASPMVRAAGMPLQVDDLPSGTLTVRVVRGAFNENLSGRQVVVEIEGGAAREAVTDAAGRATFALAPGLEVRARTDIDGELLTSQTFQLPVAGGMRVLLVAGAGAGAALPTAASGGALPPGHPPLDQAPPAIDEAAPPVRRRPRDDGDIRMAIAGLLGGLTLALAFSFGRGIWWRRRTG